MRPCLFHFIYLGNHLLNLHTTINLFLHIKAQSNIEGKLIFDIKSGRISMAKDGFKNTVNHFLHYTLRIGVVFSAVMMFFPALNPSRVTGYINKTMSLFTSAVSYSSLTQEAGRAILKGWIPEGAFVLIFAASLVLCLGILTAAVGGSISVGNLKMKNLSYTLTIAGSIVQIAGLAGIYIAYQQVSSTQYPDRVLPQFAQSFYLFLGVAALVLLVSVILAVTTPKAEKDMPYEIARPYRLFLMFLPFVALIFIFSYLPLWGWRYAFFNYKAGGTLTAENFVGFKWFTYLFENAATRQDIIRVLRNTLAMSGLGLAVSWVPMVFAIFLAEAKSARFKRTVQVFTTIPNFISWVLVYALALAMFSTDGFVNSLLMNLGLKEEATNYLMGDSNIWFKMLAWGMWKGLGWSAIIYIAAISSIDQQLYEAATVDGAGRFQKMRYITLPSLMPTYFVLLVMAIAAILSNGMDQYLVFENATNTSVITVLDLYVYQLGIQNGVIPLSTVVGMMKSIISVLLLFIGNRLSKVVRGESIV